MDRLRILDIRNQVRTDKNPSRPDRIRIQSENIRTIYIPRCEQSKTFTLKKSEGLGLKVRALLMNWFPREALNPKGGFSPMICEYKGCPKQFLVFWCSNPYELAGC